MYQVNVARRKGKRGPDIKSHDMCTIHIKGGGRVTIECGWAKGKLLSERYCLQLVKAKALRLTKC